MDIHTLLTEGKETVALRVSPVNSHGNSCTLYVDIVYARPEKGEWSDSMGFYDNSTTDKHQFKNVTLSGFFTNPVSTGDRADLNIRLLGSESKLSLDDLSIYSKTLRTIERKINNLNSKEGRTKTFGEDVARLATAVGAKAFYFLPHNNRSYRRNDSIAHIRHFVDTQITEYFDSL